MNIGSNAPTTLKKVYTPEEVAEVLAISKTTVYRLVDKRELPAHKVGGTLRFPITEINQYLEARRI